jgi:hypothetical protein
MDQIQITICTKGGAHTASAPSDSSGARDPPSRRATRTTTMGCSLGSGVLLAERRGLRLRRPPFSWRIQDFRRIQDSPSPRPLGRLRPLGMGRGVGGLRLFCR